jgi:hypothetical protein
MSRRNRNRPLRRLEQLRNRRRRDRLRRTKFGQHAQAIEKVVDRDIATADVKARATVGGLAEVVAAIIAAVASEVGAIAVVVVADDMIDGRFVTNNGHRLGPKNAVHRKPTTISRSSKRPRKSSKSIVST